MEISTFCHDIYEEGLIKWVLSNPRKKTQDLKKSVIKPVKIGDQLMFQVESFTETQAFHKNYEPSQLSEAVTDLNESAGFKQWQVFGHSKDYQVLVSKKGQLNIKTTKATKQATNISHNRKKQYIFEENKAIPFMVALGIMTESGKVVNSKYAKFRQINRYVEMVEDVISNLPTDRTIKIIDFGSGKSYLTFALYHYLVYIKSYKVEITGLDLKADVIRDCQKLKEKIGYDGLTFKIGDINDYEGEQKVDMVITLHACNMATDAALKKAVGWDAEVIMSVPCCHKEMNKQVKEEDFSGLFEYGIVRERVSALFTDTIRAKWLTAMGYEVQMLEFIDMAHTPKNIMIRGIKTGKPSDEALDAVKALETSLGLDLDITR